MPWAPDIVPPDFALPATSEQRVGNY